VDDIDRMMYKRLKNSLSNAKVKVLFGPRRVGKTSLLRKLHEEFGEKSLLLNAEDADVQEMFRVRSKANYTRLLEGKVLLMLDEAQVMPDSGMALKFIHDELPQIRVIATGSSAFDLANRIGEPLVGRCQMLDMFPLAQIELGAQQSPIQTKQKLEERLIYGSYPEVVTLNTLVDKEEYLRDLVRTYLLKDILAFEGLRSPKKLNDLLKMLAYQAGKEVNNNELATALQISRATVERYLDLLAKCFVIYRAGGFSRNLRKEITKNQIWFFMDNGVRNAIMGDFRPLAKRTDVGDLWASYLFGERTKALSYNQRHVEAHFWRTYDHQEIDRVEVEGKTLRAYEFKWSSRAKAKIPGGFARAYPKASFDVITPDNYMPFILNEDPFVEMDDNGGVDSNAES